MSPIVHGLVAWLIAAMFAKDVNDRRLITIAGVAMDIDGIFILFDRAAYFELHHTFGHSLVFGILVALTAYALSAEKVKVFAGAFAAFSLHVIADLAVTNWSVAILSPFSDYRLFVGQDPALVAMIYPAVFLASWGLIFYIAYRKGISPLEFISAKLDKYVIRHIFLVKEVKTEGQQIP